MEWPSGKMTSVFDMNTARELVSCGLVGDKIVVAGASEYGDVYSQSEVFSLETGRWSEGPDLPMPLHQSVAVATGNTFRVFGGSEALFETRKIFEFDEFVFDWKRWIIGFACSGFPIPDFSGPERTFPGSGNINSRSGNREMAFKRAKLQ